MGDFNDSDQWLPDHPDFYLGNSHFPFHQHHNILPFDNATSNNIYTTTDDDFPLHNAANNVSHEVIPNRSTSASLDRGSASLDHRTNTSSPGERTSSGTLSASSSLSNTPPAQLEKIQSQQVPKLKRQISEDSQSDALVRVRKTRKVTASNQTTAGRRKKSCFVCIVQKKKCQDGGDPGVPCKRCAGDRIHFIPGLYRPRCWRPKLGYTELFRRGPTIDFAASLRGNIDDAVPGKQALWRHFATRPSGSEESKIVELSQNWTADTLRIPLDRYHPKETDKQYYAWDDEKGAKHFYPTQAYGIANLPVVRSAIERFFGNNFEGYIAAHMLEANEITQKTFHTAQNHMHLPLVERALKLWVGCRFIEEPWSIVGSEKLGMSVDAHPESPYHTRVPVPPIVDLQIDLIVINEFLQPELKKILQDLKMKLNSGAAWNNWFEIYLAYFILLHNVELTMAHDAWFVKRHNLKRKYSNKALVDTIMQGATTLLTYFHYAHQGYTPFSNPELVQTAQWTDEQREYLHDIRSILQHIQGDHVHDPAHELFWTSQLHNPNWRPVILIA